MDQIARLLIWLEPYLAWVLGLVEAGGPLGLVFALAAGVLLGLSPVTYPMIPAVVGCVLREKRPTKDRAAALGLAFALGVSTVYAILGFAFGGFGLALLTLLNRSIWLWYALLAPVLWVMGLRALGFFSFGVPLLRPVRPGPWLRGTPGAYLLGLPFGLVGCPTCALILPSMLAAVAAGGSPILGALTLLGLGLGQGVTLVAAAAIGGGSSSPGWLYGHRAVVEKGVGVLLLLTAAYFTWRVLIYL